MYLHQFHRNIFLALLFLAALIPAEALNDGRGRRKSAVSNIKQAVDEATEKAESIPDQMALATSHTESNQQRRGGVFSSDVNAENYPYGNLEMNLIRPESESPIHTRITAKYRFSTKKQDDAESLEDAATAEEYVAKAMKKNIFGTRLREPINIPAQAEAADTQAYGDEEQSKTNHRGHSYKLKEQDYQAEQRPDQVQQDYQQQKDYLQQHQDHQYQEQQQNQQNHQQFQQSQIDELASEHARQQEQQQAFIQAYEAQTEQIEIENKSQQPAPVYEKDGIVKTYENPIEAAPFDGAQSVDRHYRTKYDYQPYREGDSRGKNGEEKSRVSSSTEIPRAEIMKQIEKSVIKYMRELEAEGRIVTQPQEQKSYYQIVTVPGEEKALGVTTLKPKLMTTTASYHGTRAPLSQKPVAYNNNNNNHANSKYHPKVHYQSETESRFQASASSQRQHNHQQQKQKQQQKQHQAQLADLADSVAPNVEFIYKIKTRTPLQTATVKTVSKPYTLPMKTTIEQFDHTAALKNMEEFDLSHVVTAEESDPDSSSNYGKPKKLYFNSEIYHDINSLPLKAEKAIGVAEYRKIKSQSNEYQPDYKGYSAGYFAEPAPLNGDREQAESSQIENDDGYPLANPYKYVLKKEAIPLGIEDHAVANWEQQRVHGKPHYAVVSAQKSLEFDSYSPKFNNNPEGYGYQHSVKGLLSSGEREHTNTKYLTRHTLVKRGKRGGHSHTHSHANNKKIKRGAVKDVEASIALRPPPKL